MQNLDNTIKPERKHPRLVDCSPAIVGVVGSSGAGKTTLLTRLLPLLRERGLQVAVLKHAHHTFDIDHAGKDSFQLRKAGAAQVLVASRERWALMVETPGGTEAPPLESLLARLDRRRLDLVLVEGFRHEAFPKIEVQRPLAGCRAFCPSDPHVIALATDAAPERSITVPVLDLNAPCMIAEFVLARL